MTAQFLSDALHLCALRPDVFKMENVKLLTVEQLAEALADVAMEDDPTQ